MPYDHTEGSIFAARSAYADLVDAIRSLPCERDEVEEFCLEAERFVLALAARIASEDLAVEPEECAFLAEFVDRPRPADEGVAYALECAEEWKKPEIVPSFFLVAASLPDKETAKSMLCAIQIIGNNAAAVDGRVLPRENEFVRSCINNLERHLG